MNAAPAIPGAVSAADAAEAGIAAPERVPTPRRARRRARRESEILRMTAQVVAERGYHNASVEEVAARLDLAKASIYHYFDTKEALVYACLQTCAAEVQRRLEHVAASGGTPSERMALLIETQIRLITAEFPEMARLFLHPLDWPDQIKSSIERWRSEHDAIFREVVNEGILTGEFDPDTATVGRKLLHGGLNNVPEWSTSHPLPEPSIAVTVEAAMRMFCRDDARARSVPPEGAPAS
jgi:TetR/AcrR family transcriptional regulator of autoinduction and epiphytic fitness